MEAQEQHKVLARISGAVPAVLTTAGWEANDLVLPVLNIVADIGSFGPGDGDPIRCAADAAAKLLAGKVDFIVELPDDGEVTH